MPPSASHMTNNDTITVFDPTTTTTNPVTMNDKKADLSIYLLEGSTNVNVNVNDHPPILLCPTGHTQRDRSSTIAFDDHSHLQARRMRMLTVEIGSVPGGGQTHRPLTPSSGPSTPRVPTLRPRSQSPTDSWPIQSSASPSEMLRNRIRAQLPSREFFSQ